MNKKFRRLEGIKSIFRQGLRAGAHTRVSGAVTKHLRHKVDFQAFEPTRYACHSTIKDDIHWWSSLLPLFEESKLRLKERAMAAWYKKEE